MKIFSKILAQNWGWKFCEYWLCWCSQKMKSTLDYQQSIDSMRWQHTFNNPISATVLPGENSPNYAVPRSKKDVSYHVVFDDWWNDADLWITQNWISTKLLISKPTASYAGVRLDFEIQIIYSVAEIYFSFSILWEIKKKSWTFVVTSSEFHRNFEQKNHFYRPSVQK